MLRAYADRQQFFTDKSAQTGNYSRSMAVGVKAFGDYLLNVAIACATNAGSAECRQQRLARSYQTAARWRKLDETKNVTAETAAAEVVITSIMEKMGWTSPGLLRKIRAG